jgi:hypothetical protein
MRGIAKPGILAVTAGMIGIAALTGLARTSQRHAPLPAGATAPNPANDPANRIRVSGQFERGSTHWHDALILSASGKFRRKYHGCMEGSSTSGTYELATGWVRFATSPQPHAGGEGPDLQPLVPVSWGARHYLLAKEEIPEFCSAIHNGDEPGRQLPLGGFQGLFWLRAGDERKPVRGWPNLPAEWRDYLLATPIEGSIIQSRYGKSVMINVGRRHGLRPGMLLYDKAATIAGREFRVTGLEEESATLRVLDLNDFFPRQPQVGDSVSTRNRVGENWGRRPGAGESWMLPSVP